MFDILIKTFSYFGFFLLGLISSSTVIFPLPIYGIVAISVHFGYNPFLVALSTAIGLTLGELTGYLVGYGSYKLAEKKLKKSEKYKKYKKLVEKYGAVTIFLFAFLPMPFDIIGMICGSTKYDIKKFLLITFIGKFLKMLAIVYGFYVAEKIFF